MATSYVPAGMFQSWVTGRRKLRDVSFIVGATKVKEGGVQATYFRPFGSEYFAEGQLLTLMNDRDRRRGSHRVAPKELGRDVWTSE
jgi:hypothetical protein